MEREIVIAFRIIGANECEDCKKLMKAMDHYGFSYEFMDANADANEEFCDKYNVDKLPVVQAFNRNSGHVITSVEGMVHPPSFLKKASEVAQIVYRMKDNKSPYNRTKDRKLKGDPYTAAAKMKQKKGCQNCNERKRKT